MLSFPTGCFLDWHLFIHPGDGRKNQCSGQREDKSNCHSVFLIKKMEQFLIVGENQKKNKYAHRDLYTRTCVLQMDIYMYYQIQPSRRILFLPQVFTLGNRLAQMTDLRSHRQYVNLTSGCLTLKTHRKENFSLFNFQRLTFYLSPTKIKRGRNGQMCIKNKKSHND